MPDLISSMLFFPEREFAARPEDFGLKVQEVHPKTSDGVELFGWYFPQPGPALLFLHGNAGNISHRLPIARGWVERGFSILLLDYRGFGRSQGQIQGEQDLYADAAAGYRFLVEGQKISPQRVVLYGESIGCAGVIEVATKSPVGAAVLIAPFTKLSDLAKVHYGWIPEGAVDHYRFDNEAKIAQVTAPIFILQGTDDEICPISMGRRLFEKAAHIKEAYWVPGGHHNDLPDMAAPDFWDKPSDFLRRNLST